MASPTRTQHRWRSSMAAATAFLVGAGLLVAAGRASAAPTGPDPQKAVTYLTAPAQLTSGHYYAPSEPGRADWGLTIDGALALAAQGGNDAAYAKLVDFIGADGKDAAGTDVISWTGIGTDHVDGGAVGKLALLAEVAGRDPQSFAGRNLVAELAGVTCTGTTAIAQSSCAGKGNYAGASSVFKQSLGILGQGRAGADVAVPAAFLLGLQNADGGWPGLIPSGASASDVDSTAMAVMALTLAGGDAAAAATQKGITWLAGAQLPDGSFPGFGSNPAHSTNSTALALQALRLSAGDHAAQIAKALDFLATRQNADGGLDIDANADGSDVRATTEAVNGMVGRSYATLLRDPGARSHAAKGAAYLVGQLAGGTHIESSFDDGSGNVQTFVDYGLTADLALALASANTQDPALAKVVGYLRAHVGDYVDQTGAAGGPYGGAAGKLAVVAESTGQNPAAFGGVDLLKILSGNVCSTGNPDPNAYDPCSAVGDFRGAYSGISQALGVLALGRAGVAVPSAALTRLGQLQCADGGFSSVLIAPGAACTSDVDTTGYAVQALSLEPGSSSSVARGWAYLRSVQGADGGFSGASGVNANSTGLAVQADLALLAHGRYVGASVAATKVAVPGLTTPAGSVNGVRAGYAFLESLQRADGGFDVAPTQVGDAGTRVRATTQAVPALADGVLTTLLDPVTPVDPAPPTTTTTSSSSSTSSTSSSTTTSSSASSSTSPTDSTSSGTSTPSPSSATTDRPGAGSGTPTPSAGSTPADAGATVASAASGSLAHTGTPVAAVVGVALLLLLAGAALLVARRLTVNAERR